MRSIAIIPARGGSKRIPRKNIKNFYGNPIIKYSIDVAKKSGIFDEVMVSTDDNEIAEISKEIGASIPFMRSKETSNDYAIIDDVIKEVITNYRLIGKEFDYYCLIYPTAPFISENILREAMNTLCASKAGFLTPVVKFSYPPQRSFIIEGGFLKWRFPEYSKSRSQDLKEWYHDCGQFSAGRIDMLFNIEYSERERIPFILSEEEVQDIDTEDDWYRAELKYELMLRKKLKNNLNNNMG